MAVWLTRACVQNVSIHVTRPEAIPGVESFVISVLSSSHQKYSLLSYSSQTERTALGKMSPTTPQLTI